MINSKYTVGGIATVEDTSSAMSLQAVLVQSVTDTFMNIFSSKNAVVERGTAILECDI